MDLSYAMVKVGDDYVLNSKKIKLEDAFEVIKENSLKTINEASMLMELGNNSSFPQNFDIINNLLKREVVYATPHISFHQFKGEKLLGEYPVSTFRSKDVCGLGNDVLKFLERGLEIYIYSYYIMSVGRYIDDELTIQEPWFWYRMGIKQKQ